MAAEQAVLNVLYGNFEADLAAAESRLKNALRQATFPLDLLLIYDLLCCLS